MKLFHAVLITALLGVNTNLSSDEIVWPDLPQSGFLVGRSATTEDLDNGTAVFTLKTNGKYVGHPVNVEIPQYAIHTDEETGSRTPVVIVQVETNGEVTAVGYRDVRDWSDGIGLFHEFDFLGKNRPSR